MTRPPTTTSAFQHHQAGRLSQAEALYRQMLTVRPNDRDTLYLLGVLCHQTGRSAVAADLIQRAIQLGKRTPEAHTNLGLILRTLGQIDEAAAEFLAVTQLQPERADIHHTLGGLRHRQGRLDDALTHYRQALALKPDHPGLLMDLGNALLDQGRAVQAAEHYRQALALTPDSPEALANYGNALKDLGDAPAALAALDQALALKPTLAEAHLNRGVLLQRAGRSAEALAAIDHALALKPDWAAAWNNRGIILQEQERIPEAMAAFERALHLKPDLASAWNNRGNLLQEQGRLAEALAAFDRALALKPDDAEVHYNRSGLKRFRAGDPDLAILEALAADATRFSCAQAAFLHLALGKALDDVGESGRAFEQFQKGNALKRRSVIYDEAATANLFTRIAAVFDRRLLAGRQGVGDPSRAPIFIVGMPRSGSTLIEQILASHPQVLGAGEITALPTLSEGLPGYPESILSWDDETLHRVGQAYLARLPARGAGQSRVADKMLGNFLHIGLIRLILPNAKIIHTRRDPLDTCLSCFTKMFWTGQAFSYDLGELGRYYKRYRDLMAHWHAVLPKDAILDVDYEDVVDDLDGQARRLLAYCDLPWDDRCLAFHQTERTVRTASAAQVRQPVFRSSVRRSHGYQADLGPLLRAIDGV